ncbi:LL-diaminopimelate aminotransferase [Gehongia tenuis]|uniref:LL-diaminopimelate aminotransferase n=1 Tax=Gehongia tenuis TaxID=2763655 RepID=A0A926D2W7_9FIRM|nr:LL-diaminopimelate aminotransferase [Gehongia tenuis]MBC8530484.1 LL-diaminopimelate aminotransferase [Gehongia tenuis]
MINRNYLELKDSYLFAEVESRVAKYTAEHPGADVIRLGIGDVTRPLTPAVTAALHRAVDEMGEADTFRGYGPYAGYAFLREAIRGHYGKRNVALGLNEIFVSDGAKSDLGNILDIFGADISVLIPDPVYPVYVDTNVMAGRKIGFLQATEQNGFLPLPDPAVHGDIIYLCSPGNPTGAVYDRAGLAAWVDYANREGAVILFDAAYEAFVTGDLPRSIYEIPGTETCAIEFGSFSKTAGFTGTRCGYTVVPEALVRDGESLGALWLRRQSTKFNGTPYIVQRAAEAVYSEAGFAEAMANIAVYRENARVIADALTAAGVWFTGGENSPYIWLKCPGGMDSWTFFDRLLSKAQVVGTPGEGFGQNGEGFFRLTAFASPENTRRAARRLQDFLRAL